VIKRTDLSRLLDVDYTDDQLDAITAPADPLLIVAGAGSGKTAVMAARVVWLVGTGQVAPEQVLGLTFTNKAASSLSSRITRALEIADLADPTEPGPVVSTYHSFAGQVLSDYGLRVGVEPHARVITDAARAQLALLTLRRTALPLTAITGRPVNHVGSVIGLDDAIAEQGLTVDHLAFYDHDLIAEIDALDKTTVPVRDWRDTARKRLELGQLVTEFRQAKRERDLIDFADHIRLALDIVRSQPDVVSALREQFPAVLLDEYQDTSVAQRLFLSAAFGSGHNLTAVGDPLQAIYGWRGASVDNIESFPVHFPQRSGAPAIDLSLAANMRSGGKILAAANEVAAPLRAESTQIRPLTQGNPTRGTGNVRVALHETWAAEMEWIADQVAQLVADGVKPDDIAVLTRRGSELGDMDTALAARGIPTSVADLEGLLSVPEVVDIVSMLDVLNDPTANTSLLRLLTGPRWAIGHRDLTFLARRAKAIAMTHRLGLPDDASLDEQVAARLVTDPVDVVALIDAVEDPGDAPISAEAAERCAEFTRELRVLRRYVDEPLADLILRVAAFTGLDLELASSPSLVSRNRAAVVSSFVDLAANFASLDGESTLETFLAWLQAGDDLEAVPSLSIPPAPGAVALLTVHRSKGLEWPVVVLPAVAASVFPSARGRSKHTRSATQLPHVLRADGAALPRDPRPVKADIDRFDDEMKSFARLEELRLGYVACTRAETLLIASAHWWGPSQKKPRGPSEILTSLYEAALAGAGEIVAWTDEPAEDATNPQLDEVTRVPFVQTSTSDEAQRRRELAQSVTAALPARQGNAAEGFDASTLAALDDRGLDAESREFFVAWDEDAERVIARLLADRSRIRDVVLPATLTASQVQSLAADPVTFTRRLARPMPQAPRPAATRGSELHRGIERRYGAAALIDLDDLSGAGDPEVAVTDVRDLLAAFDASPWASRVPRAVEWSFALTVGSRLLRGRVDAVFNGAAVPVTEVPLVGVATGDPDAGVPATLDPAQGVVLVDWKTGRPGSGDPLQLALYRLAWARAHEVDPDLIRACFVHWPSGVVVAPTELPTQADIEALLAPHA
jgi:DNA helicase-2/ATP-dependent DNA helicase PcrA